MTRWSTYDLLTITTHLTHLSLFLGGGVGGEARPAGGCEFIFQ